MGVCKEPFTVMWRLMTKASNYRCIASIASISIGYLQERVEISVTGSFLVNRSLIFLKDDVGVCKEPFVVITVNDKNCLIFVALLAC